MAFWEDFLSKARDVADTVGEKTGDFVNATKLKMALADVKREMSVTMEGLGRLVYDAYKTDADVSDLIEQAYARMAQLEEKQNELERALCAYRKACVCNECGAINADDARFCKACGKEL